VTALVLLLLLVVAATIIHTNLIFLSRVKVLSGAHAGRVGKLLESTHRVSIRKGALKFEVGSLVQPCQQLMMAHTYRVRVSGGREVSVRGSSLHAQNELVKGRNYDVRLDKPNHTRRGSKAENAKEAKEEEEGGAKVQISGSAMVFLSPVHLARQAYITRITKIKILVQFVQICTRLPSAFRLNYPPFVMRMLTALQVLEVVDIFTIPLKLECWRRLNYIDRTMMHTIGCLAVILALQIFISKRPVVRMAATTGVIVDNRLRRMSSIGRRASASKIAQSAIQIATRKRWDKLRQYVLNRRRITSQNITTLRAKLESLRSQQGRLSAEDLLLLFTYIIYTSICDTLFTYFDCEQLEDGKWYLVADPSILCTDSEYLHVYPFVVAISFAIPLGIPLYYSYALWRKRNHVTPELRSIINDPHSRSQFETRRRIVGYDQAEEWVKARTRDLNIQAKRTQFLWGPYKTTFYYFEVLDMGRRFIVIGLPKLLRAVAPDAQIELYIGMLAMSLAPILYESLEPYRSEYDHQLMMATQVAQVVVLLCGMLMDGLSNKSVASWIVSVIVFCTLVPMLFALLHAVYKPDRGTTVRKRDQLKWRKTRDLLLSPVRHGDGTEISPTSAPFVTRPRSLTTLTNAPVVAISSATGASKSGVILPVPVAVSEAINAVSRAVDDGEADMLSAIMVLAEQINTEASKLVAFSAASASAGLSAGREVIDVDLQQDMVGEKEDRRKRILRLVLTIYNLLAAMGVRGEDVDDFMSTLGPTILADGFDFAAAMGRSSGTGDVGDGSTKLGKQSNYGMRKCYRWCCARSSGGRKVGPITSVKAGAKAKKSERRADLGMVEPLVDDESSSGDNVSSILAKKPEVTRPRVHSARAPTKPMSSVSSHLVLEPISRSSSMNFGPAGSSSSALVLEPISLPSSPVHAMSTIPTTKEERLKNRLKGPSPGNLESRKDSMS
jgi:hypothetical protein